MADSDMMRCENDILDTIPAAIFCAIFQDETIITRMSQPIETITGYLPSHFITSKNSLESLILREDRKHRLNSILKCNDFHSSYFSEYRLMRKDGTIRWVSEQGRITMRGDRGRVISGILSDITERKAGEFASLIRAERFIKSFDAVPDLIAILGPDHRILEMNKPMADLLGCKPEECLGDFCFTHIHKTATFPEFCPHCRSLADGKVHTEEVEGSALPGIFQVTTTPFFDENKKIAGCVHIAHDITEIKNQQKKLQEYVQEQELLNLNLKETQDEISRFTTMLEGKVVAQTLQLQKLSEETLERNRMVEHLLKQKDQFINQLAHDLRTPLTPVIGLLPTLRENIADPHLLEIIQLFEVRIGYLREMMEEVIRYAHLNSQVYIDDYGFFDLQDLVEKTFEMNLGFAQQNQVRMVHSVPPGISIMLSKSQAPLLFRNVIINAIQFNKPGGMITVGSKVHAGWVTIPISDTGNGIPADQIEHIWDEFSTGDPSRKNPQLKGMGLPIVKRIVTMHRGYIIVSSLGEGQGATFTLTLPLVPIPSTSPE